MSSFIGTVFETPSISRIKFSTKPGGHVRVGELVEINADGTKQLGRIISINRRNYLIDQDSAVQLSSLYESKTDINAKSIGIRGEFEDYIVGEIEIIGRRQGTIFRRPRTPISIGEKVFVADENFLKEQIKPLNKSIVIGSFRMNENIDVHLDLNEILTKHFCVLAMTGMGKSWAVAVIIEQIAREYDIPIIIFDPHGEYSSLCCERGAGNSDSKKVINKTKIYVTAAEQVKKLLDKRFENKFHKDRKSQRLCVNLGDLETYQIIYLLEKLHDISEAQRRILQAGWSAIHKDPDLRSTTDIEKIKNKLSEVAGRVVYGEASPHILNTKLELLYDKAPFIRKDIGEPVIKILELVKKGQLTIIDMSGMELIFQQALIAIVANKILEGRMLDEIPPVLTIFEEAHRFMPSGGEMTASKPSLKRIAQEGRKFMMGLGIVSQRPSRVDSDVLSQCNTQIILRLTNPDDQRYVRAISEHVTDEDLEEIKSLSPGKLIFSVALFHYLLLL